VVRIVSLSLEPAGLRALRAPAEAACRSVDRRRISGSGPTRADPTIGVAAPMAFFPFGGTKSSFFGDLKAHGRDSIRFFTDAKVVISRWL
jgi:hypothetical protein